MALSLKNPEAERLARELARRTGETVGDAVVQALRERLRKIEGRATVPSVKSTLLEISERCAALPDLDSRSADEILGYDGLGFPS